MKKERDRGYGSGLVISSEVPDYLVGRVLTVVEALGLKESQEKSVKDILKNEIYGLLSQSHNRYDCAYIMGGLHNQIRYALEDFEEETIGKVTLSSSSNPVSYGDDYEWTVSYKKIV